jgi:short-subunit dehydrogenase
LRRGRLGTSVKKVGACARHSGRIVNIASIGDKLAVPHLLLYSSSRFTLVGLSEGIRVELARE